MPDDLIDPAHETRDMRLVNRARREGWPVPEETKKAIVERLTEIVEKRSVTVPTKDGVEKADDPADKNAIAASKVLVGIVQQNDKQRPPRTKKVRHIHTLEPVTNGNLDERKRAIAARLVELCDNPGGSGSPGTPVGGTGSGT